jgi:hypothetical protein
MAAIVSPIAAILNTILIATIWRSLNGCLGAALAAIKPSTLLLRGLLRRGLSL